MKTKNIEDIKFWLLICFLSCFVASNTFAATVTLRLTKKYEILQSYYDNPNDFPICKSKLDYIMFNQAPDKLICNNGQRLFETKKTGIEVYKGAGKNYNFTGKEVIDEIAAHEAVGLDVEYVLVYREDWLKLKGKGGPWIQDKRILSEQELQNIRKALKESNLTCKNTVKIIQLFGARVAGLRGDSWFEIEKDPKLMTYLESFDGIGIECHIGDYSKKVEDGPQTLDCMALITKWAKNKKKLAYIFMGGTAATYTAMESNKQTYNFLWSKMESLGVKKTDDHLLYYRQGARAGKHLPENESSLTNQVKWLIEELQQ